MTLAGPAIGRVRLGAFAAFLLVALLFAGLLAADPLAAASPDPSPGAAGGDPRSEGEGPGFVGEPLLAIGGVLVLGLISAVVTVGYVRATGGRKEARPDG